MIESGMRDRSCRLLEGADGLDQNQALKDADYPLLSMLMMLSSFPCICCIPCSRSAKSRLM